MTANLKCSYPEGYEEKCRKTLESAISKVPVYRSWKNMDTIGNDIFSRYNALPFIDKSVMRKCGPNGFIPAGLNLNEALAKGEVEIVNTSGSTGDQVSNVWCQSWWDASERSSWKLNAHSNKFCTGKHREAILASPLCVGVPNENFYLSQADRSLGRFLFLNERIDPSNWTEQHMGRMVSELNDYQPEIIEANPSYLARLSRFISKYTLKVHMPLLIIFTYENPSLLHLRQIGSAFNNVPMASSYGSTETGYVFMQCECGYFHQNTEHCHVDFIPFSEKHGGPLTGSILVTTFDNPWRVLLRFDIGDIVTLSDAPCKCGRKSGLTLKSIEGRAVNLTISTDGRAVTQAEADRAIAGISCISDYQVIQTAYEKYSISYTAEDSVPSPDVEYALHKTLAPVYGEKAEFEFSRVDGLPPDPPGKYRLAKSLIDINPVKFWNIQ